MKLKGFDINIVLKWVIKEIGIKNHTTFRWNDQQQKSWPK